MSNGKRKRTEMSPISEEGSGEIAATGGAMPAISMLKQKGSRRYIEQGEREILVSLQMDIKVAQQAFNAVFSKIVARYRLTDNESVNVDTGEITKMTAAEVAKLKQQAQQSQMGLES